MDGDSIKSDEDHQVEKEDGGILKEEEDGIPESEKEDGIREKEDGIHESRKAIHYLPNQGWPEAGGTLFPYTVNGTYETLAEAKQIPKGIAAIGASVMWKRGLTGKGVVVGVIDTGIYPHPDLASRIVLRRTYTGETGPPVHPHGTHVAGTIAADGRLRGVAYEASLGDYRVLDGKGRGSMDKICEAIRDAVRDGCHVLNLSLGGPTDYPPMRAAIQHAVSMNVVVVVAAGNEGDGNIRTEERSYPAMYPTTESVGAANYNGARTKPAYFTNTNREVDCCAHGVDVLSTVPKGYASFSGTSMASPHVAGACALLVQQQVEAGAAYTVGSIRAALEAFAKDVAPPGPDAATGKGFVTFNPSI